LRQFGGALAPFDDYITWTPADKRWNQVELIGRTMRPRVPALHVNTLHDHSIGETTRLFKYLQDVGTPDQYMIIGAGPHCSYFADGFYDLRVEDLVKADFGPEQKVTDLKSVPKLSDMKFGDLEVGDTRYGKDDHGWQTLFLNWFGYWLKGEKNNVPDMPKVQIYVMGKGWISDDHWPLKKTRFTNYYLSSNSAFQLSEKGGALSNSPPTSEETDSYLYDPSMPVPSLGGNLEENSPARDQRPVEERKDVLLYSTPPLDKPVTIAGPIDVVLYVSSTAKDTDFMVKLIDVYPDGKAINLNDDAFRVRYREGFDKKVLMEPTGVYKITLSNMVTAVHFPKGHRIRLDISSSNFPEYERNLNTGGNNYDETNYVVASNSIHHSSRYPSHIVIPELPD